MVLRDYLLLAIFSSNIFSLTAIISTFQLQLADKPIIANSLMIVHTIAFVSMNFHGGCLTIVRLICMIDMNFMEESLGEKLVRNLSIGISLAAAISSSCAQILNNDMYSGQIYYLITKETVILGKKIIQQSLSRDYVCKFTHIKIYISNLKTEGEVHGERYKLRE